MSKLQIVNELHRNVRRNFRRRHTVMRGIAETLQADLVEMIPYKNQNRQMKYILTVIDIFSKKAYARAIRNKSGLEVTQALESVIKSINRPIKNLHVDNGREFYNSFMKKMLAKYKVNIYSTFSLKKAAIIERFNRTLKSKMWKQFSIRGNYKWIDILNKLIDEYNHTKHRTIKMAPVFVKDENVQDLLNTVYNYKILIPFKRIKYKIGDPVRISKYKYIFEKGYTPNWTTEIFRIRKVCFTDPITYLLMDYEGNNIEGSVYEEELQKTKYPNSFLVERIIKQKGDRIFVKWLGFKNSHNSWISRNSWIK